MKDNFHNVGEVVELVKLAGQNKPWSFPCKSTQYPLSFSSPHTKLSN